MGGRKKEEEGEADGRRSIPLIKKGKLAKIDRAVNASDRRL